MQMGIKLTHCNLFGRGAFVLNRRIDMDLRKVVDEGKRLMRMCGPDKAAEYLLRYSVPVPVISRLLDERRGACAK